MLVGRSIFPKRGGKLHFHAPFGALVNYVNYYHLQISPRKECLARSRMRHPLRSSSSRAISRSETVRLKRYKGTSRSETRVTLGYKKPGTSRSETLATFGQRYKGTSRSETRGTLRSEIQRNFQVRNTRDFKVRNTRDF